jgi:hypothetical protein
MGVQSFGGYGLVLQIHCFDEHGIIRFHEVRQVFPPGFMLDALAACVEDLEFVFVVAVEVIVERFAAYCTGCSPRATPLCRGRRWY